MPTRQQYIDGDVSHEDYYAQFCTEWGQRLVVATIGEERLRSEFAKDEHLNGIPLSQWDVIGLKINTTMLRVKLDMAGDSVTQAGLVCIAKQNARIALLNETLHGIEVNDET
jgi:hypothetical protein